MWRLGMGWIGSFIVAQLVQRIQGYWAVEASDVGICCMTTVSLTISSHFFMPHLRYIHSWQNHWASPALETLMKLLISRDAQSIETTLKYTTKLFLQ